MKKHICVAISVLFILSLQGCGNSSDSAEASEKTVVTQSEEATESSVQDGKVKEKKRLQKWETYYADGRLVEYGIYSYDGEGNAKEQKYDSGSFFGDSLEWTRTYSYDNAGNVTQEQLFVNEGDIPLWYIIYSYDNQGNLSERQQFAFDGTLFSYSIYSYDNQGNLTREQEYNSEHKATNSYTVYDYDEQGNRILEQFYLKISDDEQASIYYSYDEEGNMTKRECYNPLGNLFMYTVYTY